MVKQISVFIENTTGRIAEITRILGSSGINLRAISIADTADFGILRIVSDKPDEALKVLKQGGFTAKETDVIGAEVSDQPGGLAFVMDVLDKEDVNIEYLYATLECKADKAVVIFKVEDIDHAVSVLNKNNISIIDSF